MLKQTFFVPGPLPGMNEMLNAAKNEYQRGRKRRVTGYEVLRRRYVPLITVHIRLYRVTQVRAARFDFVWYECARQRDPDNIASGKKFIFDALVSMKILQNDGWAQILEWHDSFRVNADRPGVFVTMESELQPKEERMQNG